MPRKPLTVTALRKVDERFGWVQFSDGKKYAFVWHGMKRAWIFTGSRLMPHGEHEGFSFESGPRAQALTAHLSLRTT